MSQSRLFDLSHTLIPGKEEYRLEIDTRFTEQWTHFAKYPRAINQWYILSEVCFSTHVGTHIEFPYHHIKDGLDASRFPLEGLIGEGIVVDISTWGHNDCISLVDTQKNCNNRICPGDILFFYTGLDRFYYTDKRHHRPWFTTEAIHWLVDCKIKVLGIDTSGIEVRNPDGSVFNGQPNHEILLGAGIPLVEYLTNLKELINQRFQTYILPVKMEGAEAFPVRVIAITEE